MICRYRVLKSSWGIAIDIDMAILFEKDANDHRIINILPSIYLKIEDDSFPNSLIDKLEKASIDSAEFIYSQINELVVFVVNSVDYNPTDFQPEGLYYAMQQCIYQHFNATPPSHDVYFDSASNKYVFQQHN